MQRTFYATILAAIAFLWLAEKMWRLVRRIEKDAMGEKLLDRRVGGYTPAEAHRFVGLIGEEGRGAYRWMVRLDVVFAAAYAILFGSLGIMLMGLLVNRGWGILGWLPAAGGLLFVAAALIDLDEGRHVARLIKTWPRTDEAAARRGSTATRLKWRCLIGGGALLVAGAAFFVVSLAGALL